MRSLLNLTPPTIFRQGVSLCQLWPLDCGSAAPFGRFNEGLNGRDKCVQPSLVADFRRTNGLSALQTCVQHAAESVWVNLIDAIRLFREFGEHHTVKRSHRAETMWTTVNNGIKLL